MGLDQPLGGSLRWDCEAYKGVRVGGTEQKSRKLFTSIALEESTINELKALAEWRGVPYQVLMRMFILDGLHKSQAAVAR